MSFVINLDDPPVPPEPGPADAPIAGGWFPAIDPRKIREGYRIREAVTPARLREALIAAIITVTNDLGAWQAGQDAAGHASLAAVPAPSIDGQSRLLHLYVRAVALNAKAEIVERYRDIDITGPGERRAEDLDPSVGELRRDALHAVRDILGKSRTTVELI
ncbi:Phage head completion protein (GPL) [Sphingomonas laterariae]|uniref:Phage head completion protein (GPL) n=1 Tax=Edaphosphingomonas laterariae TaxID=861865 RepID=A0A239CIZ2_9SPHN|nr:head completion/stabilization protein [Sphingomonas laterariae]SNS20137.1 Phage head completion protein (GPL) [Sphingomonas laterariae]